jgi:hypothetical protein
MSWNQVSGSAMLRYRKTVGIPIRGNMNPESRMLGRNPKTERIIACICVFETVEIRIPHTSVEQMKRSVRRYRSPRLPRTGTPKTTRPIARPIVSCAYPTAR